MKLTLHSMSEVAACKTENYVFRRFYVGDGNTIIAEVCGIDFLPSADPAQMGYPRPTIAEAEKIAKEICERWNAHERFWKD